MNRKKKTLAFAIGVMMLINMAQAKLSMDDKLKKLREEMTKQGYSACIIPSEDEHQSEYVTSYDKRRAWISDFTGSSGVAVVTETEAAVWADSRYYLQAEDQLDSKYWKLMKSSEPETPRIEEWLKTKLSAGKIVALNAKFTSIATWQSRENELKKGDIQLKSPNTDLIDIIWPSDERPAKPSTEIRIHDIKFTGKTWAEKISLVQAKIKENEADLYVVTALDEVAWLLNLRASDIPNNPMFFAYFIVFKDEKANSHRLYINQTRLTQGLKDYMTGIQAKDYESITTDIKQLSDSKLKIWISPMSSYAIYNSVSNISLMVNKASPIRSIKARKNDVELKNLRDCHIRDSAARIRHMHWLETEMSKGTRITEKSSAQKLEDIQKEDILFRMKSFGSISAVGKNAAVVHYSTDEGDDSTLTKDKVYLLDAGGNYEDCTTDVTRTHHYGKPSSQEIYAYTKVLQGSTNLANIVFPPGVYGRELDVEARSELWRVGLDYGHGTGHGIGYFLSVHESPPSTSYSSRSSYDETFVAGMIQSDEPGYYEDGFFGIRLETDIETVEAKTEYHFRDRKYLKFEPLTFVPFEKNLIDKCQLTKQQVDWLNTYNKQIRDKVGPKLNNYQEARKYLMDKTEPFQYSHTYPECLTYNQASQRKSLNYSILVTLSVFLTFIFHF